MMDHHLTKIEHLGIAVKSLDEGNALYTKILGVPPYKEESVESEGVRTSFFKAGPNKIELLEATNPESPIAKFIEKRGEGIHHVAYAVEISKPKWRVSKAKASLYSTKSPRLVQITNGCVSCTPKARAVR